MEAPTWVISSIFSDKEPLADEQYSQLVNELSQSEAAREQFTALLEETLDKKKSSFKRDPVMSLKTAQACYALRRYADAIDWLDWSGESKQACYLKAICLRILGRFDEAIAQFEQAESKGCDSFQIAILIADCLRRAGNLDEAAEKLKRLSRVGDIRADYHYQLGRLHDAGGRHEEAMEEYEQAINLDSNHAEALFHLAYAYDLYGDEDQAVEYYRQCVTTGRAPVSALLNLAVLMEEKEDYLSALKCVKRVLTAYPNHPRARMFLKDIESSTTMYYDEDQERRIDRRNKVLEIPISDFELSVRSRNCLKKMNIRTLGDLLKVTESELLAYKNFGETSLQEIKTILTAKGLRLGQMLEEHKNGPHSAVEKEPVDEQENEVLQMSVTQLEMSVRSRKCLERLNINSVGDLIKCTEAELLGCKNFGMTSLTEIKDSLKEHGLSLRRLEE